uniref:Plexin domain-containing protein 2 n=1 Tax=Panagrellus redivivus TaxID=6233 RepID=A0A7E4UYP9_PANRE
MLLRLFLNIALAAGTLIEYDVSPASDIQHLRQKREDNARWLPTIPPDYEVEDEENDPKSSTTEHTYYNMTILTPDPEAFSKYWINMTEWLKNSSVVGQSKHDHLDNAYRKAAGIKMRFDFPFYGHKLNNMTIATGGFCYVGEQTHSWLAATQYIAPLMANFDTNSSDSTIMFGDDGKKMVIQWTNVRLRDDLNAGPFTFQLALFDTGDIWFVYKDVPIPASNISDANHPCKIGVSDAYLFTHKIKLFEEGNQAQSKRVIHEYHRITVPADRVVSNAVVVLKALPTCLQYTDCQACNNVTLNYFTCSWCKPKDNSPGFCSDHDGLHRRRQDWVEGNCMREQSDTCEDPADTSTATNPTTKAANHPDAVISLPTDEKTKAAKSETAKKGSSFLTIFIVLAILAVAAGIWVYYAFTNPYSKSGQILIKYRPSKWRSPASQVRYSASVHM